jgi:hypothetical protein
MFSAARLVTMCFAAEYGHQGVRFSQIDQFR